MDKLAREILNRMTNNKADLTTEELTELRRLLYNESATANMLMQLHEIESENMKKKENWFNSVFKRLEIKPGVLGKADINSGTITWESKEE